MDNSCGRDILTLWRFKWSLSLLFVILMNNVTAKWPPDPPPQLYAPNSPPQNIDDFSEIDLRHFGNEQFINGNGNALFDKTTGDERTLQDMPHTNQKDALTAAKEEKCQRKFQWLSVWLLGESQQQIIREQQEQRLGKQQQKLLHLNTNRRQSGNIFVKKKSPEISASDELESESSQAMDARTNDVTDGNVIAEDVEKGGDMAEDIITDDVYDKDEGNLVGTPFDGDGYDYIPHTKRIPFFRLRRLDYAYIPYTAYKHEQQRKLKEDQKFKFKRNKTENGGLRSFLPSISVGAMAHLGNFFTDLSKNVHYNEKIQPLSHPQSKLLEGQHPLRQLHEKITGEHEANAEFLHAIRTYRPSQKIRSLVSMNPRGYHGAQFIDPNYMWVGLGK